ncbi:MAG: RagB/SusD family nutrient uptake outer membrane protein [Pseudobacter sp.]|uniref:RagB/SusD family nutrient uptake outer membrane protein n=1 Tax=Pseudobacter sp. TaxID=2045420 RepID=UPI003F8145A1
MKRTYLIILIASCFTSCVKDLDTIPMTENVLLSEAAWLDSTSYEKFLSKIYAGLALSGNEGPFGSNDMSAPDQGEATFVRSFWNLQQLCTDEVIGVEDSETKRGLYFCQWNSSNSMVALNYTRLYLNIAYANEYLRQTAAEKVSNRQVSASLAQKIEGYRAEARALRALNYYFLMDLYGRVPLIDEDFPVGNNNVSQQDRSVLFPWIEAELKAVEGRLPAGDKLHYGMINDATVQMLLAKMYLNAEVYIQQNRYTECLTYLNKVLNAGFSIDPLYRNIFRADNEKSPEIIFPLIYDGMRATTFGGTTFLIAGASKSDMNPMTSLGFSQAWASVRAKESLSRRFEDNDLRAMFYKTDRTLENTEWNDFNKGWSVSKYSNLKSDGTPGSNTAHADTDFPLFRLADAWLMYAEAVLRGGQGGTRVQALSYVQQLRQRSNASVIDDAALTLDFILDERSRELFWEGHRRTDLIRFNKFTKNYAWPWKNGIYGGVASIDDKFNLYPIPATELTSNALLKQHTGY